MKYINQLDYPNIPYPTDIDNTMPDKNMDMMAGTIKTSGCGLC